MIKTVFLLIFYVFCFAKVNGNRYEVFESLETFSRISLNNIIEKIQEDRLIFPIVMEDFRKRFFPFIRSFMGTNRIVIRDQVNETLTTIENLIQAENSSAEITECVEVNKKILLYLYVTSLSDWTCLKSRVSELVEIVIGTWGTIFEFSLVTDDACLVPILCSGINLAKLTGRMAVHGAKFMSLASDFFPGMRKCQKDFSKLKTNTDAVIDKIRLCGSSE